MRKITFNYGKDGPYDMVFTSRIPGGRLHVLRNKNGELFNMVTPLAGEPERHSKRVSLEKVKIPFTDSNRARWHSRQGIHFPKRKR